MTRAFEHDAIIIIIIIIIVDVVIVVSQLSKSAKPGKAVKSKIIRATSENKGNRPCDAKEADDASDVLVLEGLAFGNCARVRQQGAGQWRC